MPTPDSKMCLKSLLHEDEPQPPMSLAILMEVAKPEGLPHPPPDFANHMPNPVKEEPSLTSEDDSPGPSSKKPKTTSPLDRICLSDSIHTGGPSEPSSIAGPSKEKKSRRRLARSPIKEFVHDNNGPSEPSYTAGPSEPSSITVPSEPSYIAGPSEKKSKRRLAGKSGEEPVQMNDYRSEFSPDPRARLVSRSVKNVRVPSSSEESGKDGAATDSDYVSGGKGGKEGGKRERGRPRKVKSGNGAGAKGEESAVKRKRGRPSKNP
ncbi:hypothetical protein HK097_008827, partial [Rhizophlyctis rosea]